MKNLFKTFALTLLASATFSSCDTDPCKDVVCGDFGQCVEGSCACNTGYEADAAGLCNTLQRAKFLTVNTDGTITSANYAVVDVCSSSGNSSYTVNVSANATDISQVNINNFWEEFTNPVVATITGSTITIARQQPDATNSVTEEQYFVEGTGTLANGVITFSYTITNEFNPSSIQTDNCNNVTWTK